MIYLFNQIEELIDVIDEASLAEFTHTIELNQFDRASFEIPVDYKPNIIKEAQFFGFQSRDRAFCLFRISEKSYDIGLTVQGIDRAESDLHSFIIEDKRPGGTASDVLREILKGTGYQLGNVDGLTRTGRLSFYYISVRQALVKIIESYACEFKIRYTFVENKIIGRYIDLNQRFGRVTGHQFEYGSNILNVTYEESSDDVVTALIGRGKGEESTNESGETTGGYGRRIQFKDVSWSVSKGDPVDKPAGQNYVSNETARNIYGLHQNGVIKHRFGVYTNEDIEDPVELLKATYKELQRLSIPIVTFKANLLDLANAIEQDVWIGDSVGIVRDQIGIAFEARIHKLIIDKLDDNRSAAELGDYQTLQAKDRTTRQQAIIDAVSGFSESLIEEAIANEVQRRDKEFDEKMRINKLEFDNALESVKAKAEEDKQKLYDTIDQQFQAFDNGPLQEAKRKSEEALENAGASSLLANQAQQIAYDIVAKFVTFQNQSYLDKSAVLNDLYTLRQTVTSEVNQASEYRRTTAEALSQMTDQMAGFATKSEVRQDVTGLTETFAKLKTDTNNLISGAKSEITLAKTEFQETADGLSAKMSAIETYVGQDSQRQEALQSYTREESAKQATAVRELVAKEYVGKATYQEDVRGLERRFEGITNPQNGSIATQIANYKTAVDGRFADITSLIAGKANQTDFQRVKETNKLYERIIGRSESDIADKVARMALTNQLFQVEVSKNEGLKTIQKQLAGSWGVHNKNSVNEIIAGFNLAGRNAGIKAETIRLEGNTLADKLTAIDGYFKRLFVGEGTFATLNADIIRTNSITADKLVFNEALANRLVSNELITSKLVASRAFVNALNAITIDASQIVTGTLKGDRIYGGTIRGANIFGGTLTGHTKIQLGSYGSFDTVNGGLQINVPRDYNAKDGLGVQFIGSYGRGENVPYGLFVYKDSDFTVGNTATDTDEFIMTVGGYIKAKGIGWLKTGLGKVGSVSTGTLAFWKSTVAMDFAPNDIYYTYGGQAYGLWAIIKQNFSDKRLKENIVDCKHKALDYIQQFQFKEYDWKKQEDRPRQAHTKIGLIAQEVQAVDPTLVYENGDTLNLDNLRLTTIALKAIQELSQRIETLERKIA